MNSLFVHRFFVVFFLNLLRWLLRFGIILSWKDVERCSFGISCHMSDPFFYNKTGKFLCSLFLSPFLARLLLLLVLPQVLVVAWRHPWPWQPVLAGPSPLPRFGPNGATHFAILSSRLKPFAWQHLRQPVGKKKGRKICRNMPKTIDILSTSFNLAF